MKVTIEQKTWDLDNKTNDHLVIIDEINRIQESNGKHYSHMIIDGKEVYESYENYLNDRTVDVEHVEFILKTVRQLKDDVVISTRAYLDRALPEIQKLPDDFYRGGGTEVWTRFQQLIEGIDWLAQSVTFLSGEEEKYSNQNEYVSVNEAFGKVLLLLEDAVKSEDMTMIADVILYEITPLIETLGHALNKTLDNEVVQ